MNNKSVTEVLTEKQKDIDKEIPVSLSNQLISLLSEQLYQSPLKAIEELVINSYDANAPSCRISVPDTGHTDEPVIVYDDGIGMDDVGFETLWAIGGSNKRINGETIGNRKIVGKFGIGKLATYSIANTISYVTRKDNKIYFVKLDYSDFKSDPTGGNKAIQLPVRVIADFDFLTTEPSFIKTVKAIGLEPSALLAGYST